MSNKINVDDIVNTFEEFPTLPTIYSALNEVMENPRSTFKDAAEIISKDQASTSKILKFANSSLFSLPSRVTNISQAISLIGFIEVKNLIMAQSIIKIFDTTNGKNTINPIRLWKHSVAVAVISRHLGKAIGSKDLENYFIAGILHDMGKLFFFRYFPEQYRKAIEFSLLNRVSARVAEQKILGISHTVIGELIADKWRLPRKLKNAISFHTSGMADGKHDEMTACIHLADIASYAFQLGTDEASVIPEPNAEIWEQLDLPPQIFSYIIEDVIKDYRQSMTLLLATS